MKILKWIGIGVGVLVVALVLFAVLFDWNTLRGPIARKASEATGRTVRLDGPLKVHLLSWSPSVEVNGLKVGNAPWAGKDRMVDVERIRVAVKLLPLLTGEVILPYLEIDKPTLRLIRQASGRANWDLGKKETAKEKSEPARLPTVQRFIVRDGHLRIADEQRKLRFEGRVTSRETVGDQGHQGFRLDGSGTLNREPFRMTISGGPLVNLDPDKPYPFQADVRAGATRVTAEGRIPKPFDLGRFGTTLTVAGDDLADLYYLSGLALPNTPPYRLSGELRRDGTRFTFRDFAGKVGDSDLGGDLAIETAGGRPKLTADLKSKRLDFNDLGTLVGAPPSTKTGEAASPRQKAQAARMAAENRLLPDAPLEAERIRGMDAELRYRADTIKAPGLPLKAVALDLTLDHGLLTMHPVSFEMPQGKLLAEVALNARPDVPVTDLNLRLSDVRLEEFAQAAAPGQPAPIQGTLQARAKLRMTGNSVRRAAATADGTVAFVIPNGQIREAFAQLIGVNAAKGLGLLLSGDQKQTPLRCAVVDMGAKDGVLTTRTAVFDTEPVLVTGKGDVDLRDESLDLTVEGKSKHVNIGHIMAPVHVGGHLRKPAIGIDPVKPAAQAAAAVALGVLLTPLGAILPFIDPGLAKDANCSALLSHAKQGGTDIAPAPKR